MYEWIVISTGRRFAGSSVLIDEFNSYVSKIWSKNTSCNVQGVTIELNAALGLVFRWACERSAPWARQAAMVRRVGGGGQSGHHGRRAAPVSDGAGRRRLRGLRLHNRCLRGRSRVSWLRSQPHLSERGRLLGLGRGKWDSWSCNNPESWAAQSDSTANRLLSRKICMNMNFV